MQFRLGFIGAGNMAEAIARASIQNQVVAADRLIAFDPAEARREVFAALGVTLGRSNADVISQSEQVLLAVKPQVLAPVAEDLGRALRDDQIVLSIMAGVSTAKLGGAIGRAVRIVRIMPNTPMMVGQGMAAIALGPEARRGDQALALEVFGAGGKAIEVPESLLDAVTAVSGSGPAYVFYLAQAMERAAEDLGLGGHARLLVGQTILGAAHLLVHAAREGAEGPAELRRKVTSPGGTTEAAVHHLEGNKSFEVIVNAIKAAEERSRELGKS